MGNDSSESRYSEALGIASRVVSRLDTGSYNSVPDKDVKALADAVILMHSALSERADSEPQHPRGRAEDAARFRWLIQSGWYVGPAPEGDTEAVSWSDKNDGEDALVKAIDAAMRRGERGG